MKKFLIVLLVLVTLSGCNKQEDSQRIEETKQPMFDAYIRAMDADMDIAFLGCQDMERSLEGIFDRAINELGYLYLSEIDEDHIIYGNVAEANNVYLLIPNVNTDLKIGSYRNRKMEEVFYEQKNASPVVYVERVGSNPQGIICLKRNGTETSFLTGFDLCDSRLRVVDHVEDVTYYDYFTNVEVPYMHQPYFDYLYYQAPIASDDLQYNGYSAEPIKELQIDEDMYLVYAMKQDDVVEYYFALCHKEDHFRYYFSNDLINWVDLE